MRDSIAAVPLTIPQRFDLEGHGYGTQENWDYLRASDGPFGIPKTAEEWRLTTRRPDLRERAATIAAVRAFLDKQH